LKITRIKTPVRLKSLTRIFSIFAIVGLIGCSQPAVTAYNGETMGTYYRVSYYGNGDYASDIQSILSNVNDSMSGWLPDSEISRFNSTPIRTPVQLSPELCEVISFALQMKMFSDGAYDISIGRMVVDMGFAPKLDGQTNNREQIDQSSLPNQQEIETGNSLLLQECELTRLKTVAIIDLSSIAKGFAVDQIGRFLESKGVSQYLVDIGGELRAGDYKPDGSPWRIAVEVPSIDGGVQHVIELANTAIATSGDYRNFREVAGQIESHLIDPHSGHSVHSRLTSVSVLNASAMKADAWATALFVMGPERAMNAANRSATPVYMLLRSEQNDGVNDLGDSSESASVEVQANSFWHDHFE
jgi:FAD:protein FMN transferase